MVSFFERIPRELRDQIYCELLADNVHHIEPQGRHYSDRVTRKKFSPAILRVCQQAYNEASVVLYENNTFRYNVPRPPNDQVFDEYRDLERWSRDHWRLNLDGLDDSQDNDERYDSCYLWIHGDMDSLLNIRCLEKIRHLEINYWGSVSDLMRGSDLTDCGAAKQIWLRLEEFFDLGCALKTLRLSFDTYGNESSWEGPWAGPYYEKVEIDNPWCKKIQNVVSLLTIEKKIEIVVDSDWEDDGARFEDLPKMIADCKGWTITDLSKETVTRKEKWDDEKTEECPKQNPTARAFPKHSGHEDDSVNAAGYDSGWSGTDSPGQSSDDRFGSINSFYITAVDRNSRPETTHLWTWTLAPTTTQIGEDGSQAVEPSISKED